MKVREGVGLLGAFLLLWAIRPAAADDASPEDGRVAEDVLAVEDPFAVEDPLAVEEEPGNDEDPTDGEEATFPVRPAVDEEINRVPTYEESVLYGAETPGGTYLRLAETYLFYSEIGTRTIGHIPLWPRGALYLGRIELFPYLTGSVTWTNNANDNEDKESDVITEVGGGFTGQHQLGAGRGVVSFGLDYRQRFHSNEDVTDSEDDTQLMGGLGLTYAFTPRFWVSGGVKWEHISDPVGIEYQDEVQRDQFYPYVDVGFGDALGLGSKVQVEAGIDYASADFADRDYETGDYGEWDVHVKASYPFYKETTRIYARYDYLWSDRDSERINDLTGGHQLSFGMEGMVPLTNTGRLEGYAEAGYRQDAYGGPSYYEDGSDVLSTDSDSDVGTWVAALGLRYYAGPRTTIDLRLMRTIDHSSRGNYQIIDRGDIWITRTVMRDLLARFAAYAEQSEPSAGPSTGGYDEFRWGVGVGLRWIVTDFLDIFTDCDYSSTHTDRAGDDTGEVRVAVGVDVYFW